MSHDPKHPGTTLQDIAAFTREEVQGLIDLAARQGIAGSPTGDMMVQILCGRGQEKRAGATAGKEVQTPGILRSSASSAWRMGVNVPRPKTTAPGTGAEGKAHGTPAAKPPSKTAYFSDVIKSLNNPQRGFRQAKLDS